MASLDHMVRRLFPSIAKLTYSGWIQYPLKAFSQIPHLFFNELRTLPPPHLRARVGVGNHLFFNHLSYLKIGENFWLSNLLEGFCSQYDTVVELGCGCGRIARPLFENKAFKGTFIGIDIDDEMLSWCRQNMERTNFSFLKSEHKSTVYSKGTQEDVSKNSFWKIPLDDNTADFVYSTSLFTHLLEPEVDNYLRETYRILKPNQRTKMTFFSMDSTKRGGRWTFNHQLGRAHVEDLQLPEAAVAYPDSMMRELASSAGFKECTIVNTPDQSQIICRK